MRKVTASMAIAGAMLAVCFGALAAPSTAFAAGGATDDYIRYAGTVTVTYTSGTPGNIDKGAETDEAEVEIRCTAPGDCRLLGVDPEGFRSSIAGGIPIILTEGRTRIVQQEILRSCAARDRAGLAGELVVTATAARIVVEWRMPQVTCPTPTPSPTPTPTDPVDQDIVLSNLRLSIPSAGKTVGSPALLVVTPFPSPAPPDTSTQIDQTWEGSYVEGDPCIVDTAACPTPTPTPSTSASPAVPPPSPGSSPEPTATPPAPEPGPSSGAALGEGEPPADPGSASWGSPSILSDLRPVSQTDVTAARIAMCLVLAIVLVLLIAFPTAWLNAAIERAVDLRSTPAKKPLRHLGGWWQAAVGVVIASLITGFVDPAFGWNAGSVRIVATLAVALVIDVMLGWSARVWLMRRLCPGSPVTFRFVPYTLLIVAGAVALSRHLEFEPAVIFGLVAGIALSSALTVSEQARTELIAVGYGLVVSLAAWALYTAVPSQPGDAVALFAHEALSAAAIAGTASLPLVLFPLRGLPGYAVFRWRRDVWGAVYACGLFVFAVVLVPMPDAWTQIERPLWTWTAIYVSYVAVAGGAWIVVDRVSAAREPSVGAG